LKQALASGYPVAFGFEVFTSFETEAVAETGIQLLPQPHEHHMGGHAVLMVGYDDADQTFLVRNSWSAEWGISGYFKMPYAYAVDSKLASDFWVINK
jgi:C1A family cysteine protease